MRFMEKKALAGLSLLLMALLVVFAACAPQEEASMAEEPAGETQQASLQEAPQSIPMRDNSEARPSPNASVTQTLGTTIVTIAYSRPGVKGRQVFGGLEQYGAVWRAGANEATVFSVTDDVTINGEALPAGVYGFFAIPNETEWTLIFNKEPNQWGAFDYDQSQDALRVTATPEEGSQVEWFAYYFGELTDTSAKAFLHWDTVRVPFTISTE